MTPSTPPQWSPGDEITAEKLQRTSDAIAAASPNVPAGGASGGWGWSVAEPQREYFWAQVTSTDGLTPPGHGFKTVVEVTSDDNGSPLFEEDDSGVTDDSMRSPLYEANGGGLPVGVVVRAWRGNEDYYVCERGQGGGTGGSTSYTDHSTTYGGTSTTTHSSTTTNNFAGAVNVAATSVWTVLAATWAFAGTTIGYASSTVINYTSATLNFITATLNLASTTTVNYSSAAWNFLLDATWTITAAKTWTVTGGTVVLDSVTTVNGNFTVCGYHFWCYRTIASFAVDQNNLALGGSGVVYRISASAPVYLTGIVPAGDKQIIALVNVGAQTITLTDSGAGSAAANTILLPGGAVALGLGLGAGESAVLWYDSVSTRWRVVAHSRVPSTALVVGTTAVSGGTSTRVLYDQAGVLGEYAVSGSGGVAMTSAPTITSPVLVTPALGTPSSGLLTNCTGLPIAGGGTGQATAYAALDALTVQSGDMASAATVTLASSTGASVHITGTTTITSFGAAAAGLLRFITFGGALTLTHNATSMILIGGADVTTAAADTAIFASEGSGNWRCLAYFRNTSLPGNAQTSGTLAQFAATTSAQLKGVISDETGSGALVFNDGATITNAVITASTVRLISSLSVEDTAADHEMFIASGEDLSANRTLTVVLNDANRTLTIAGAATVSGTNTGDQTITLTGDVTGSGTGSFGATVANNAVTYAKMQDVSATSRVLGRKTAGSGDTEECTLSEVLDFVGGAAQGDILYRGAATWARLGAGTSGHFLKTLGAGADPAWAAASATLDITGLTAADLASGDEFPFYDASAAANRKATLIKVGGYSRLQPGGRLTGVTATPAGEGTSLSTLYYAPYTHDLLPLWDGTRWLLYQFTEFSLALSGLTTGKPYDVFAYDNAGTPTLEVLVWTNDTTRATGLTLTNGRYNKTGDQTRLYLGTLYTTGTTTFSDTPQHRLLWNAFNRVQYDDATWDTTDSWTDAGNGTWSAINGGNTNWIHTLVRGLDIEPTAADLQLTAQTEYQFAIALDSATTISRTATTLGGQNSGATMNTTAMARFQTGIGRHTVNGLETTASSTTRTAYGDNGAGIGGGTLGVNSGMRVRGWR